MTLGNRDRPRGRTAHRARGVTRRNRPRRVVPTYRRRHGPHPDPAAGARPVRGSRARPGVRPRRPDPRGQAALAAPHQGDGSAREQGLAVVQAKVDSGSAAPELTPPLAHPDRARHAHPDRRSGARGAGLAGAELRLRRGRAHRAQPERHHRRQGADARSPDPVADRRAAVRRGDSTSSGTSSGTTSARSSWTVSWSTRSATPSAPRAYSSGTTDSQIDAGSSTSVCLGGRGIGVDVAQQPRERLGGAPAVGPGLAPVQLGVQSFNARSRSDPRVSRGSSA